MVVGRRGVYAELVVVLLLLVVLVVDATPWKGGWRLVIGSLRLTSIATACARGWVLSGLDRRWVGASASTVTVRSTAATAGFQATRLYYRLWITAQRVGSCIRLWKLRCVNWQAGRAAEVRGMSDLRTRIITATPPKEQR